MKGGEKNSAQLFHLAALEGGETPRGKKKIAAPSGTTPGKRRAIAFFVRNEGEILTGRKSLTSWNERKKKGTSCLITEKKEGFKSIWKKKKKKEQFARSGGNSPQTGKKRGGKNRSSFIEIS